MPLGIHSVESQSWARPALLALTDQPVALTPAGFRSLILGVPSESAVWASYWYAKTRVLCTAMPQDDPVSIHQGCHNTAGHLRNG